MFDNEISAVVNLMLNPSQVTRCFGIWMAQPVIEQYSPIKNNKRAQVELHQLRERIQSPDEEFLYIGTSSVSGKSK